MNTRMITNKPQQNAWSPANVYPVDHPNISITRKKNRVTPISTLLVVNDEEEGSRRHCERKLGSFCVLPTCCQCLLLSILAASLALIVVIPILVAVLQPTSTTTSITAQISTVITTSVTTTTETTVSTTSATSSTITSSTTSSVSTSTVTTTSTATTASTNATSSTSSTSTTSTASTTTSTTVTTSTVSTSTTTFVTSISTTTATTTTVTSTTSITKPITTTSSTATSTTTACLSSYTGNLANINGAGAGFAWTQFANSYVANTTQPYLSFGLENDNLRRWWLDGISVVDVAAPSVQLLNNPSFENSTSTIVGWYVQQGCCIVNALNINTTGCIDGNNCLNFYCGPENIFSFLGQYFNAIVGHTYNISYYLKTSGSGGQPTFCDVSIR